MSVENPNVAAVANTAPPGGDQTTPPQNPQGQQPEQKPNPTAEELLLNAPPGGGDAATIPPKPEVKDDGFKPEVKDGDTEYQPTGDSRLDAAVHYFGNTLKLDLHSPEMVEASKGNFSYLEAKLEGMGAEAKDAKLYLQLAKDGMAAVGEAEKAKGEALVKTIHEAAGSADAWNETKAYAQANLKPEQINEINEGIQAGGLVATLIVSALRAQHLAHSGTTVTPQSAVAEGGAPAAVAPVSYSFKSQADWQVEYRKFIATHGITGAQRAEGYDKLMAAFPKQ
ncbi:hypothetical protein [Xanthomonas phage SB3]|uniref:Scaffolding protein n=1 Tax=Xanthomonas phage SB3 TaxID=3117472 RepID=A0ABZ2GUI4_9CAUD